MSTPLFVKYLTDISYVIMNSENKLETLKEELRQLNLKLPATVYIPFLNGKLILINREDKESHSASYTTKGSKGVCNKV